MGMPDGIILSGPATGWGQLYLHADHLIDRRALCRRGLPGDGPAATASAADAQRQHGPLESMPLAPMA